MKLEDTLLKNLKTDLEKCETIDDLIGKKGVISTLAKRLMETMLQGELTEHLGYSKHSRITKASNSRNGYSKKTLKSSLGEIPLDIPRDRNGEFDPILIKKHQKNIGDLEEKIISMYARGMSTRDIQEHIKDIYGMDISSTGISNITEKVISECQEWQTRALESLYAIVFFDALFYKVKSDGKIKNKAVYTCLGIDKNGQKDVLGIWIYEQEGSHFWLNVLNELKSRGINDILITCVDGLKGFPEAISTVFPKTEIQTCVVHQIRNSLKYIASKDQKEFVNDLKLVYKAVTKEKAEYELKNLDKKWGQKYQLVIQSWQRNWNTLSTYFKYSQPIRKLIYTTNAIENLHRQLRKTTKNRAVFTHDDSLKKLLYLTIKRATKKYGVVHNWTLTISQLAIIFKGRVKLDI
jgi:transposase-like protein